MALSKDEITNLTRQTIMEYNLEEKHYENLKRKFETRRPTILHVSFFIIRKKLFNIVKSWQIHDQSSLT